jgi:DNA topoisomerase I
VRLLDTTRVRVGNPEYARDNRTYGLTTLKDGHVSFTRAGRAVFDFHGKGRTRHRIEVADARIADIVRRCRALRGRHLFQFEDPSGACRPVNSAQVNEYLRTHLGAEFTAKDFRTWAATLRAVRLLEHTAVPDPPTERAVRATINQVVRQVAQDLHNTPAVCRRSYICPTVFDDWLEGKLPARWSERRR